MSETISIVLLFIGAFITAFAFRKELNFNKKWNNTKTVLVTAFIAFIVFGIWDVIDKSRDSSGDKKEITDTAKKEGSDTRKLVNTRSDTTDKKIDYGFDKTGKKIDSSFRVGKKGNAKRPAPYALLNLSVMPKGERNPYLLKSDKTGEVTFFVEISNWGTGFAYDVEGGVLFVDKGKNGLYVANIPRKSQLNKQWGITPDKYNHSVISKTFDMLAIGRDSAFACIKLDFSDSTRTRKSMYRVFNLEKDLIMTPSMNDDEIMVEKFLIKEKYWKPPFRQ